MVCDSVQDFRWCAIVCRTSGGVRYCAGLQVVCDSVQDFMWCAIVCRTSGGVR